MRRFRLKFFDPDTMDYKYLLRFGTRGSTPNSWQAGEFTIANLEHYANPQHAKLMQPEIAASILVAIDSGHLTKEYV